MKARRKSVVIEVRRFLPDYPWPLHVCEHHGAYAVWNELRKSHISLKLGDYVRIDDPNDAYPIDGPDFAENYQEVPDRFDDARRFSFKEPKP